MREKLNRLILRGFSFFFIISSMLIVFRTEIVHASENDSSILIKKVSKDYTKKFCNSIGFGLSKESALNFSLQENTKVFKKKKQIDYYMKMSFWNDLKIIFLTIFFILKKISG